MYVCRHPFFNSLNKKFADQTSTYYNSVHTCFHSPNHAVRFPKAALQRIQVLISSMREQKQVATQPVDSQRIQVFFIRSEKKFERRIKLDDWGQMNRGREPRTAMPKASFHALDRLSSDVHDVAMVVVGVDDVMMDVAGVVQDVAMVVVGVVQDVAMVVVGVVDDVGMDVAGIVQDVAMVVVGVADDVGMVLVGVDDVAMVLVGLVHDVVMVVLYVVDDVVMAVLYVVDDVAMVVVCVVDDVVMARIGSRMES
jgi:hypothetical protein